MSFTFSATGLPPGLSIVGSQILGTPSTPGNYTATFTVSDGVSSVSNVVSITIAPAAVPIPFWKLILSADCGSYSLDSARSQLQAFADAGSYWRDNVAIATLLAAEAGSYWRDSVEAAPLFVAEAGSYWLDSAEAAIAESGSYWLDSAVESPVFVAETGVYWLDSVEAAIAEAGSYWLDSVEIATRYSSTQVTLQGATGMTNILTGNVDDGSVVLGDLGFDYPYYDAIFRTNVFVGSNSYLTFGFGSTEYSLLSRTNPGRALHLGSVDRAYQNVFVKASANSFRVRYEGSEGTGGASSRFLEITFFSDGAMMVVKQTPDNSGLWTVTKGDNVSFTNFTPSAETSFVIMPNVAFTAYTVQPGSYT